MSFVRFRFGETVHGNSSCRPHVRALTEVLVLVDRHETQVLNDDGWWFDIESGSGTNYQTHRCNVVCGDSSLLILDQLAVSRTLSWYNCSNWPKRVVGWEL